jgi:hypothetical protein
MRVDIKGLLANPGSRKRLLVGCLIALQAREGIVTTREQAEAVYDKVRAEKS